MFEPLKVLIVEDDPDIGKIIHERIKLENFTVFMAMDGKEGLDIALREHPNVIVLDIMLPSMSGMEILSNIRHDSWGQTVPVILYTNRNPDDEMVQGVINNKPAFYLLKSDTTPSELVAKIHQVAKVSP